MHKSHMSVSDSSLLDFNESPGNPNSSTKKNAKGKKQSGGVQSPFKGVNINPL